MIADNRFHRIHHSIQPQHFDKNFGAGTSLWDQLFGTAYFPAARVAGDRLVDQPEVRSIQRYLLATVRQPQQLSVDHRS